MAWFTKKDPPPPTKPTPGPGDGEVRLPPLANALSSDERAFLVTCCDTSTPAVVTWPDLAQVRRAVFNRIDRDSLYLDIVDEGGSPYQYRHLTQCVVSFFYANRVGTFVGYEEASGAGHSPGQLSLRMPTQIAVEGRTRFRIPILASHELEVTLVLASGRHRVSRPVDINIAGTLLAFDLARDPGLEVDREASLVLTLEGSTCTVPIGVRHREVRGGEVLFGCLFHNGANGWDYAQDRELNEIVVAVERFWARNRTR
ncbi:MAG: hypothetical protein ABIO70_15585 [Pseudomonadota bacterium]